MTAYKTISTRSLKSLAEIQRLVKLGWRVVETNTHSVVLSKEV